MFLRDLLPRWIMNDPDLLRVYAYCLTEFKDVPASVRYLNERFDLEPYECFIEIERLKLDLNGLSLDSIMDKLGVLEEMKSAKVKRGNGYIRIRLMGIRTPVHASEETKLPGEETIAIMLSRWIGLDLEYLKNLAEDGTGSKDYLAMTRQVLNRFMSIVGDKALSEITTADCRSWIEDLQSGGKTGTASINDYRRALKASFNRAKGRQYMKTNPLDLVRPMQTSNPAPTVLQRDELAAFDAANPYEWLRLIIDFFLVSAKRHGEVLNLQWDDEDDEREVVSFHSTKEYRIKFGKQQELSLSKPMKEVLGRVRRFQRDHGVSSDYIFTDDRGKHITERRVRAAVIEVRQAAGLDKRVTIKAMRATVGTKLRQKGCAISTIRGIYNHSDEKTTQRYLGTTSDEERAALNSIDLTNDFFPNRKRS